MPDNDKERESEETEAGVSNSRRVAEDWRIGLEWSECRAILLRDSPRVIEGSRSGVTANDLGIQVS